MLLGAGPGGAVASLLTLLLMKRQEEEQHSLFSQGFLHGVVVHCHTFGAWPSLRPTVDERRASAALPAKSVAAISNWIIRGDVRTAQPGIAV